jgi:hypothetical protein
MVIIRTMYVYTYTSKLTVVIDCGGSGMGVAVGHHGWQTTDTAANVGSLSVYGVRVIECQP